MASCGCLVNSFNNLICTPIVWELSVVAQPPVLQKEEEGKSVTSSVYFLDFYCQNFQRNHFHALATIILIYFFLRE